MPGDDEEQTERYETLLKEVKESGGILGLSMGRLRDIHGAGKLGNIVVESIAEELKSYGLAHTPTELPTSQWRHVIVYRNGTPAAKLIAALSTVDENSAEVVRNFVNAAQTPDSAIVKKIRELVCD